MRKKNIHEPQTNKPNQKLSEMDGTRRRKALENGFSVITVSILLLLAFLTAVFLIVFPRSTKSQIEKRDLATFPAFSFQSYFAGEFTSGIATFYDDTVPFRDAFKNMGNNVKYIFGVHPSSGAVIVGGPLKVVGGNSTSSTSSASTDSGTTSSQTTSSQVTSSQTTSSQISSTQTSASQTTSYVSSQSTAVSSSSVSSSYVVSSVSGDTVSSEVSSAY